MVRMFILLLVLLGLCLSPAVQAANIILVTGTRDVDADGTQDDLEWVGWLESLGHTIDFQLDNWAGLTDDKIAALEAADLIIFSRGSSSGNYATDATEIAQWNAITTPIVLMNAYIARSSRWLWINSTTISNLEGPMMEVQDPEHPIFTGVTLDASNQVAIVDDTTGTGQTSFLGSTDVGSGTLLASTGTNSWIVEWQPGDEFYAGSGQTAGGLRMLFCAGTQEVGSTAQGEFNLTAEGEILLANIIRYMLGEDIEPGRASASDPEDGQTDVPRDVMLAWMAGENVTSQDVYFGTSLDAITTADRANPMDVLVSQGQADAAYDPEGLLDYSQTYYWRVDGFEADGVTMYAGGVWTFTTEPFAYPIKNVTATASASELDSGPENTINGSGLDENGQHSTDADDMWLGTGNGVDPVWIQYEFDKAYKLHEMLVWNYNVMFEPMLGFGLKDVTVEYSVDGAEWTVLVDVEVAQATAMSDYAANTLVDLGGVKAKYVRLTVNDNWGTLSQYGLSEVQFFSIPAQARQPQPADGQAGVSPDVALSWRAGRGAASHTVYFDTDQQTVVDGTALVDTTTESRYDLSSLDFGTVYYWKIDEVNEAEAIGVWEGDLWNFSTQEFFVLDDFESYTDDEGSRIYETWIDGWVNETGSTVGYLQAPFTEQTIVNGGSQSMPLAYDNEVAPFYSEAELDLNSQNWAANGADTLRLFVQGQTPAFVEAADGSVAMSAIGADIWGTADEFRLAYKSLTGDGSIIARVDALDAGPSTWAKTGVMIRQSTEAGAINTFMALTGGDGGGATFQQRVTADTDSVSQHTYEGNPFAPPYWVRLDREGNTFSAFISPDGETWQQAADTVTVAMTDPVLVGLALTSHNATVATGTIFSNVSATGNVTGPWQTADIGVAQPTGGNSLEDLYVALEDAAGHVAAVTNPSATALPGWQEWLIPLSDFGGVNLNSITTMYIGIGDRNNPTAGGSGLVFVDDIGVGHPMAK